ncbi:hypothetical protein JCM30197_05490 [Schleiferia thermophila]|nr:hypothetical protein JCM30197_05490 [Schleiferia thermophila]
MLQNKKLNKGMKRTFLSLVMVATYLAVSVSSCKKDDHDHDKNDTEPPVITIIQPTAVEFEVGDTVFIQVSVVDNVEMHEVDVHINNKKSGEEVYHLHRHSHSKEVNINSWWIAQAPTGHDDYILKVEAEDAAGNKSEKKHEFHVH